MENYNRIAEDVQLGKDVVLSCYINAYGCRIGDKTKIGSFVEIQRGASIGASCKISSHSFICEGVEIGDRVFIGHHVCFINDKYPRACTAAGDLQTDRDWNLVRTVVEAGATIGSGTTVLCGVSIGKNALIGAGSVVTKSVPPGEVWAGNPARFMRRLP